MCVCLHYVMLLWNTVLCTPCTHVCTYMYVETLVWTILFTAVTSFLLSGCRANIQTKCINKVIFKLVVSERLHNELSCVRPVHVHTSFQRRRICVVHTYVRMYVVSSLFSPLLFLCGVLRENWYEHDRVFVEIPSLAITWNCCVVVCNGFRLSLTACLHHTTSLGSFDMFIRCTWCGVRSVWLYMGQRSPAGGWTAVGLLTFSAHKCYRVSLTHMYIYSRHVCTSFDVFV